MKTASAQNVDSLIAVLKSVPESSRNNPEDTTDCYLLYELIQIYYEDSQAGLFSLDLKTRAEKKMGELPADHRLVKVYKRYLASAYNDLGMYYRENVEVTRALEHFHMSLKLHEELKNKMEAGELFNNLATVYYDIGDKDKALEFFKKSYDVLKLSDKKADIVQVLVNLAYINYVKTNFDESIRYYALCLSQSEKMGDKKFISECINGMGLIYAEKKEYKKALEAYNRSLRLREEINDLKGITTTLNNIGNCYRLQKKYKEALAYSIRSLAMSRELNSFERMRQAAFSLKDEYEGLGRYKEALTMYELYIQLKDSTSNVSTRKQALKEQLEYDYQKKKIILQEEQDRLKKLYEQKQEFNIILAFVLVFLSIIVFYALYYRYKFKKEEESKNLYIDLKEQLKREIRQKVSIANSIIHIQEEERGKLAAELHDGVNQLLFAAKIQMQAAKSKHDEMYLDAIKLVDSAILEIESIAGNQGSFLLKNKLLKDALVDLVSKMKGNKNIEIVFSDYGLNEELISQDWKINSLRIMQELLNNAIKHSFSKKCYIAIKTTKTHLVFSVTDTGIGMNPEAVSSGNGLKNIANKVTLMKGSKRTFTLLNKGTKIVIEIPLHLNHD